MPLLSRALQALAVALLVGVSTFAMMRALPGDAAWRIAAGRYGYDNVDAAAAASVRAELGLDGPALPALLQWLGDLFRLDFGVSLVSGQPVAAELAHQLGASLQLALAAVALSLLIGPPLGVAAGLRPGGALDRALLVAATAFRATPQFLLALVLIVLVSVELGWLPAAGHGAARHVILPSLALALGLAATSARIARDATTEIAATAFWRFAEFKGLSRGQVLWRHGLRNVAVPLLTLLGLQFVTLVEGVVVVETIFGWPGIGHALVHAIFARDVPVVQGAALMLGLGFVAVNAAIDIALRRIDPRGAA
ncbi:ABC transporter permease [Rubrimonas cliftonensis]|uniref:Peptide/nickel transport system permease protein n=1 Tax=Rubrimonas cliftonensis TaxID=89524 RepID=A0A1H4FBE7_9RHOB|nr:ABC transporter permease [Rubrimonas cliftonensis]SEA94624.1 peptide/nickel transport system permease protein [Rubrimonas cliftonensis]